MRAWILAGGRSSRYGSDKAVAMIDGIPLVLRLAGVLREAGLDPVLVSKEPRGLPLPERLESPDVWHPLHGVATVLQEGTALFVPCDAIGLTVGQVTALLARAPAVARGQPLFGVFPGEWAERARRAVAEGWAVRRFVDGLEEVDVGEIGNLNEVRG